MSVDVGTITKSGDNVAIHGMIKEGGIESKSGELDDVKEGVCGGTSDLDTFGTTNRGNNGNVIGGFEHV